MGALSLSSRAIIGTFFAHLAVDMKNSWVGKLGMFFDSDQPSETYKWLGMTPAMRKWIGGRQAKGFREGGITILNEPYEATLEVLVRELRHDKTGQILVRIRELAARTNTHWAKLLSDLIIAAPSTVCYDGQYFFDTDHSEGSSGTQSNCVSVDISALPTTVHGTATAPSSEEMSKSILTGVQSILAFLDDQGEPMNELASEFLVMLPPTLLQVGLTACVAPVLAAAVTNLIPLTPGFTITPIVNPRLTWTDRFAVFRTDSEVKPFICQNEEPVTMSAIAEGSELEFNEDKHNYGVKAVRGVGYGYWQNGCEIIMT
jgi:phage major head subunit gpT-like protein